MTTPTAEDPRSAIMVPFQVFIRGIPRSKGSKRPFRNKYSGKIAMVEQGSDAQRAWESAVHSTVQAAWDGPPLEGPLEIRLVFYFLRPATASKNRPPTWRDKTPDLDKIWRLVGDALEGVVYRNDAQVCRALLEKRYGDESGAWIMVDALREDT